MAGIIIIPNTEKESKLQRNLLAYLPEITLLISGGRGLGTRFCTLTSSTPVIIHLFLELGITYLGFKILQ